MASSIKLEDIVSIESIGIKKVYDIETDNRCYYLHNNNELPILVHNSAKTYDTIQFLMYYCQVNEDKNKDILIFRQTYADLKKTVLKDFVKILKMYGLYNVANHTKSHPQNYNMFGNVIYFTGLDGMGSHGERHDIIWGNEGMELNFEDFKQLNQRCNEAFFIDYNPSFTQHWIFNSIIPRRDTFHIRTTQLDNAFLPKGQRDEILAYEPWEPGSYHVTSEGEMMYNGLEIDDKNQPPPHMENINQGTADEFMWKVYGLGLRGAMRGQIFKNIHWIDKFPGELAFTYGMDFGFVCFTGDTLIKTERGDINIKDVAVGDKVLTRQGYRRVLNRFDNGIKPVIKKQIEFDFGYKEISATFEHNFNVNGKWKQFGKLENQDNLCLLSNSTDTNTVDTQKENIQTTISENGAVGKTQKAKGYTMLFISFLKEIFLMGFIFTTKITTLLITIPIIWLALLLVNTVKLIMFLRRTCSLTSRNKIDKKTGTLKKTGKTEGPLLQKDCLTMKECVSNAQHSSKQQTRTKDFVQKNATINGNILPKLIRLKCNAKLAIQNLWATSILNPKRAVINAHMSYQQITGLKTSAPRLERVYDLHIEGVHEYFANGILVHNCDPTALVKFAKEGRNIYMELLLYKPISNPEDLDAALTALGVSKFVPITADSSDRYTSERHGSVKMVRDLFDLGWEISKVSKTKAVIFWLQKMTGCKIHVVKNHLWQNVKTEQENYVYMEINGIQVNKAVEHGAHFFDGGRYAFMSWDTDNLSADFS